MESPAISELRERSLTELTAALADGSLSPVELVEQTFSELDRLEPRLNAMITTDRERAFTRARSARISDRRGPLSGVPFTVKDTIEVAGLRATAGSRLFVDHTPDRSATLVERLTNAGAILVGKTNCAEFGIGNLETCSPVRGQTHNPWSSLHSPGGSSGGDSAAVAAGIATFGVGTDYGGSVRFPAHCTGVVALRPTPGRVPLDGQLPHLAARPAPSAPSRLQRDLQTPGFLSRSAFDLNLLLTVAAGHRLARPRVERIAWFIDKTDHDVADTVERAAVSLRDSGATVERVVTPDVAEAAELLSTLRSTEGLPEIAEWAKGREELLSPLVRKLLAQPLVPSTPDLAARVAKWRTWARHLFRSYDVLLMPVASQPAFLIQTDARQPDRSALDRCTRLVTLLGLPAVVVPFGSSASGLPIGVQLVAAPGRDEDAIAAAQTLEAVFGRWNLEQETR